MPVVIPYYGGKFKLSKRLIPMIPPHKHYIEVFAGGLSMFFTKVKAEWNCINDISKDLVNLYMVIGDRYLFNTFARKAFYMLKSRAYYDQIRYEVKSNDSFIMPDVDRAFKYYYMIRNSFNGRLNTAFSKDTSGWTTNILDGLTFARKALDGVIIECMDYKDLISKYCSKQNAFWYFDPPYTMAKDEGYYISTFTDRNNFK